MARKSPEYGILGTETNHSAERGYRDWKQVSGYFDGDGSADFDPGKWVLFPRLGFVDNYRPQLEMLTTFLVSQGVKPWNFHHDVSGAWKVGVSQAESLRIMASQMWSHCFKKRDELKAVLDYLDSKMTGNEFVEVLNHSVRLGNRTGGIRHVDIPYTREEGQRLRKIESAEWARAMGTKNSSLTDEEAEEVKRSLMSGEATNKELAEKYGVKPATISRIVFGRGRGG
jgi:hypothetical protein